MNGRTRACAAVIGAALGLALCLPAGLSSAKTGATTRPGPIIIVYRDDVSNVRQMKGVAHYDGVLGRDPSVAFTVINDSGDQVCNGTFTPEPHRTGKFSLTCFNGTFSGTGSYERKAGDRATSFVARGQTSRGQRIMLVVGKPAGIAEGQFLSP